MADTLIKRMTSSDADFDSALTALLDWESVSNPSVVETVADVLAKVRGEGDTAVVGFTQRFDGWEAKGAADLEIPRSRLQTALENIDGDVRAALETAAQRIRDYHQHQRQESWSYREADGTLLG
ncbi:MAG: histidinol dehydrogenase, partial [Gammaproteobacteria bacterium]|nr:histidinol dehydrogenase [Gammaproteobacteria bacterium]